MNRNRQSLPLRIERLNELASNLSWSWNSTAREVFRRVDYTLWRNTNHNPIKMLDLVTSERLEELARDPSFLEIYDSVFEMLTHARTGDGTWWSCRYGNLPESPIAYFSAEFAVHQSVPIYAGGLGVLAGDHCKEASDLGAPLIGVGFRYSMGYFHQMISPEGSQIELYDLCPIEETPLERALTPDGEPCTVAVTLGQVSILVAVWLLKLGRVTLYLLDTDLEENPQWARELSSRLYAGEHELRLKQEIIFGIGGVRALRALRYDPSVWHLNEGHAALVVFERIREQVEAGQTLMAALTSLRTTTVFTTHTPLPAGHDVFPLDLVRDELSGFWPSAAIDRNTLLALADFDSGHGTQFNMTALAIRGSGAVNGVSRIHRDVTTKMFAPIWSGEKPIEAITNGVHIPTWVAPAMNAIFERYLSPDWKERQDDPSLWERIFSIPDEELWEARQSLKTHLLAFIREHARSRWIQRQLGAAQLAAGGTMLDPSALTIGFARRFTDYKRSDLIFHDPARLARLLNATAQPVQLIFAGKAHPADEPGKKGLQRIYQRALDPQFGGRLAFIDDYNLHTAHFFVQGCDLWLNNPRRPLEACGTSGMKASINGVPHLSVDDGWWSEAYTGSNGWLIDPGEAGGEDAEADNIYQLLEEQIIPAFYQRDQRGVPTQWMAFVKQAIRTVAPQFCARRMVKEYIEKMYAPQTRLRSASQTAGAEALER
jgi:starch phosphorylase